MWKSWSVLWPFIKPNLNRLLVALALGILLGQLSIIPPTLAELLINSFDRKPLESTKIIATIFSWFPSLSLKYSSDQDYFKTVVAIAVFLPIYFLIFGIIKYFHYYLIKFIAEQTVSQIRLKLMNKLLELDPYFYMRSKSDAGGLISRTLNDTMILQEGLQFYGDLFREPVIAIFLVIWMFYLNWKMALFCFIFLPVFMFVIKKVTKSLRRFGRESQESLEKLTSVFKESLDGIRTIQSYNLEEKTKNKFKKLVADYLDRRGKIIRREELASPINEFFSSSLLGVVCIIQAYFIFNNHSSIGSFAGFLWAAGLLGNPIKKTQTALVRVQQNIVAIERLSEILNEQNTIQDTEGAGDFPKDWDKITFKNVHFKYGEKEVLKDINLEVLRGESIALVGESGSGKTTLVNLLERFFNPSSGYIAIGSKKLEQIKIKNLRENVALVTQDVFLFNDTVKNNILANHETADELKVNKSLELANANKFISVLPQGSLSIVGERGGNFSGGEKQRLSLARAFYKDAPILILDEATSALDSVSEIEVQKGINSLIKGRTAFIIAHRFSTIKNVDKIIVMNKGQIIETGTHDELLAKKGHYYNLFQLQH